AAWSGWGTGLKPAHEPIVLARKPLDGTVAANVQAHGTGALHIAATRLPVTSSRDAAAAATGAQRYRASDPNGFDAGRWPPNVLLTHAAGCGDTCVSGCPVADVDAQSGA